MLQAARRFIQNSVFTIQYSLFICECGRGANDARWVAAYHRRALFNSFPRTLCRTVLSRTRAAAQLNI